MAELFKPRRLEIYESLQVAGACSIAALAERLGRAPDTLYYHIKKLVEIGVIELTPERSGEGQPGRNGAVYQTVAGMVTMQLDLRSGRSREVWEKGASSILRSAQREVVDALDSGEVETEGPARNLMVRRTKVRLDAKALAELNGMLERIEKKMDRRIAEARGDLHALTLALTPLPEPE